MPRNPTVASFKGGHINLNNLEDAVAEIATIQRVPRIVDTVIWRDAKCRDLVRSILFTSQSLSLGLEQDPAFQRSRNYFVNEWLCYALLRDNVVNSINVTLPVLRSYYDTHKQDYYLSPTVSLRTIRTRSEAKAAQAVKRILAGESFAVVERELSETSLRQRGTILGPFPTTQPVSLIPPPSEVIDAAREMEVGQTTGPMRVKDNYFVIQTAGKTRGEQRAFDDVVEYVETRVRQNEGDRVTRQFVDALRKEFGAEENENAIDNPKTHAGDIVATIGATLIPYSECTDLNFRVRGPAVEASKLEPTKLRRFLLPYLLAEAGKVRGYTDRDEFRRTMFHCDLLRLGQRAINMAADKRTPQPTDMEIRKVYEDERKSTEPKSRREKDVPYETARENIRDALYQIKRSETEKLIVDEMFAASDYKLTTSPLTSRLTALEALVAAAPQIPANCQVRMISTTRSDTPTTEGQMLITPAVSCGRREFWKIVCVRNDGATTSLVDFYVQGEHPMLDGSSRFMESPLYKPWAKLWRFDSDSLGRHALDNGINDFVAKYNNKVHINCRVEFEWDAKGPKACWIVFELRPLDPDATELLTMKYSAEKGLLQRKPIRDCVPCEEQRILMNEPF